MIIEFHARNEYVISVDGYIVRLLQSTTANSSAGMAENRHVQTYVITMIEQTPRYNAEPAFVEHHRNLSV